MTKQSAIITGAAKRIGRSIAIALAERGYDIGLHYHQSIKEAQETQKIIESIGQECVLLPADLQNATQTSDLIGIGANKLSNTNLLINNASIFEKGELLETDLKDLERNFAIHLHAPFLLTLAFARTCKQGNVINVIDSRITKTDTEYFAYLLSKKSLYDFTRLAAKSLAPAIRINAIAPGSTLKPIDWPDEAVDYMQLRAKQVPLHMPGDPEFLMQGIDYLLANPFVTGECLFIDGGAHIEY